MLSENEHQPGLSHINYSIIRLKVNIKYTFIVYLTGLLILVKYS